jgi:hypothetical protein
MFMITSDANLTTHQSDSGVLLLTGGVRDLLGMVILSALPGICYRYLNNLRSGRVQ